MGFSYTLLPRLTNTTATAGRRSPPRERPRGSGGRKGWNKLVTKVDDQQKGGYRFVGEFLEERQYNLATGAVVVGQIPVGSAKSGNHWRAGVVGSGGVEWEDRTWPSTTSQRVFPKEVSKAQ